MLAAVFAGSLVIQIATRGELLSLAFLLNICVTADLLIPNSLAMSAFFISGFAAFISRPVATDGTGFS